MRVVFSYGLKNKSNITRLLNFDELRVEIQPVAFKFWMQLQVTSQPHIEATWLMSSVSVRSIQKIGVS